MAVQNLRGGIILPSENLYIAFEHPGLGTQRTGTAIHMDITFEAAVFGLLHQIGHGRVAVKGQQHGWTSFEDLIGEAFVQAVPARLDGGADPYAAPLVRYS